MVSIINRKAELVVQDAAACQEPVDLAERAEMMKFLHKRRKDIEVGRIRPMQEIIEALATKK